MKARLPQGYGGGASNMQGMLKQAQKMQAQIAQVQAELEEKEHTVSVGGGAVQVVMTGKKELKALTIKPEVVDPEDIEMLQDLVISAVNEVIREIEDELQKKWRKSPVAGAYRGCSESMEYHVLPLTRLIEHFATAAWHWKKIRPAAGFLCTESTERKSLGFCQLHCGSAGKNQALQSLPEFNRS